MQIADKMQKASEDVKQMVRKLRPFRGGNDLLRALHDLDIRDKHEALVMSTPRLDSGVLPIRNSESNIWELDYTKIGLLPFDPGPSFHDPDHDIIGKLPGSAIDLRIADGFPLAGQPTLAILNKQSDLVQSIIESFETHFQGSS